MVTAEMNALMMLFLEMSICIREGAELALYKLPIYLSARSNANELIASDAFQLLKLKILKIKSHKH